MGVGNIGCCDKSSAMKVSEISVQSLTNRDSNEAFIFSSSMVGQPSATAEFQVQNILNRMKNLRKLESFWTLSLKLINYTSSKSLTIHPTGLINSLRKFKDGYIFFGSKYKEDENIINDYKLKFRDSEKFSSSRGRYFMIFYKLETGTY